MSHLLQDRGLLDQVSQVKSISLVGNGPIAKRASALIDEADLIIRINRGDLCGVAGRRTDILLLRHAHLIGAAIAGGGDPMNPLAQRGAREFWFLEAPRNADDQTYVDWLSKGGPVKYLDESNIGSTTAAMSKYHESSATLKPTTGCFAIHYLLEKYPNATVTLFGFTHDGWQGHSWDTERRWIESLIEAGRLRKAPLEGELVRLPMTQQVRNQLLRLFRHIKRLRF